MRRPVASFLISLVAASVAASVVLATSNIVWEALNEGTDARRLAMGVFLHWTGLVPFVLLVGTPAWLLLWNIIHRLHRWRAGLVPASAFVLAGGVNGLAGILLVHGLAGIKPTTALPGIFAVFAAAGGVGGATAWWAERRFAQGCPRKGMRQA